MKQEYDADLRRRAIVRAMLRPDELMAAALAEWPDLDLATAIDADVARVWQLRFSVWPRPGYWRTDVQRLASAVDADFLRLEQFLARLGARPRT
jgi:hypothetical protein